MKIQQEDHLKALLSIQSENELFDEIAAVAKDMGYEYCGYGIQMPVPISRPTVVLFNNYSKEWRECCNERGYLALDSTAQHGLRNTLPIAWSPEAFESFPELWEEARAHGLHYGWTQSSRDASGAIGMLTLGRSAEQVSEGEFYANRARMAWLTQVAHASMAKLLVPKYVPETLIIMTAREKEVLRWTAEGKTAYEIGQILVVSERTVNFHISNVVTKLGASNKTQAAVKAAALGMLR